MTIVRNTAVLCIMHFSAVAISENGVTYNSVPPGSYSSNDISVVIVNVTESWRTTDRSCGVRLVIYRFHTSTLEQS